MSETGYPLTDQGNADRFVDMFGDTVRYCADLQDWLIYDGTRWSKGSEAAVLGLASTVGEVLWRSAATLEERRWARRTNSLAGAKRILCCAEVHPRIQVRFVDLDSYPYLLNCANGVVDLRTGELMPHDRRLLLTRICHVSFSPSAPLDPPCFGAFLKRALGDDVAALADLQLIMGCALTGEHQAKQMFWLYGSPASGKTTFLEMFRRLLGEYACRMSDLAGSAMNLPGVRLAIVEETTAVQASAGLRAITCESVIARRKYQNPICFSATHKLFVDGNQWPVIRGTDDAAWRRIRTIHFANAVPQAEVDPRFLEKLATEAPGILVWAVAGAQRWLSGATWSELAEAAC